MSPIVFAMPVIAVVLIVFWSVVGKRMMGATDRRYGDYKVGALAHRMGARQGVFLALGIYACISLLGYFMTSAWQFFALAFLVGTVQGGSQALSRSLFARMIPKHKSSEYFGFFSVFEKFAGVAGPALFAASVMLFGSSRAAVLSVILFFVAGALVLTRVDVTKGEAQARVAV